MQEKKIKKNRIIHSSFLKLQFIYLPILYFIKFLRLSKLIKQNQEYENIIRWNDSGEKFIILDKPTLISKILPIYFRHQKFSSFLKQLNLYGFQRTSLEKNNTYYYNTQFTKFSPNLQIKKKQRQQFAQSELETSILRNNLNQIKISQQILRQQIYECIQTVDKMSSVTQYLLNLLFESKISASNQAKAILNAALKIMYGMLPQFCVTSSKLLEITFPKSEILQLENAMSYLGNTAILPQVHITLFQIFNYLSSYYPATQFSKYDEAFSHIQKSQQFFQEYATQTQQFKIVE